MTPEHLPLGTPKTLSPIPIEEWGESTGGAPGYFAFAGTADFTSGFLQPARYLASRSPKSGSPALTTRAVSRAAFAASLATTGAAMANFLLLISLVGWPTHTNSLGHRWPRRLSCTSGAPKCHMGHLAIASHGIAAVDSPPCADATPSVSTPQAMRRAASSPAA